jgi:hypothetical protein
MYPYRWLLAWFLAWFVVTVLFFNLTAQLVAGVSLIILCQLVCLELTLERDMKIRNTLIDLIMKLFSELKK